MNELEVDEFVRSRITILSKDWLMDRAENDETIKRLIAIAGQALSAAHDALATATQISRFTDQDLVDASKATHGARQRVHEIVTSNRDET